MIIALNGLTFFENHENNLDSKSFCENDMGTRALLPKPCSNNKIVVFIYIEDRV